MTFLFLNFFAPEIQIFLILIGWFQNFDARKKAGFSLVVLNFFPTISGALNFSENFDAMNVRRDGKSPSLSPTVIQFYSFSKTIQCNTNHFLRNILIYVSSSYHINISISFDFY